MWLSASHGPQILEEMNRALNFDQETDSDAMIAHSAAQWSSLADTMAKTHGIWLSKQLVFGADNFTSGLRS